MLGKPDTAVTKEVPIRIDDLSLKLWREQVLRSSYRLVKFYSTSWNLFFCMRLDERCFEKIILGGIGEFINPVNHMDHHSSEHSSQTISLLVDSKLQEVAAPDCSPVLDNLINSSASPDLPSAIGL